MTDMPLDSNLVIVIAGPTASGKSALAIELARQWPITIINADSKQLYGELRILSARPDDAELRAAPHSLYGCVRGDELVSAGAWVRLAMGEIKACWEQLRIPVLVGGSGLYIKALIDGFHDMPDVPTAIRDEANARLEALGVDGLAQELFAHCPDMHGELDAANPMRVTRAWEIFQHTGKSLKAWQAEPLVPPLPEACFAPFMLLREREVLYERANERVHVMLREGVLDEVRALMQANYLVSSPLMRAHGVPHFVAHLNGDLALDEAVALTQRDTRHYIKRQHTWWRNHTQGFHALSLPPMNAETAVQEIMRCCTA